MVMPVIRLMACLHGPACVQDTKRILQDEIDTLRATIFRIEGAARVEADRRW